MKFWHGLALFALLVATFSYASISDSFGRKAYGTWQSLEPDSWASVWLIRTHIDPDADIVIRPAGSRLDVETPFATPDSAYSRDKQSSGFEKLLGHIEEPDTALIRMGEIIHGMESATWSFEEDEAPRIVEQAYRTLQARFDRQYVPAICYGQFFDTLYQSVKQKDDSTQMSRALDGALAAISADCEWAAAGGAGDIALKEKNHVETVPVAEILSPIASGRKVIFVDTRETQEFDESHIPGAINIKLRDINDESVAALKGADLVVSYCLKDFRGYEVARKLMHHGVENSAIMDPHGYVAWRALGLPIAIENEPGASALARLDSCAQDPVKCLNKDVQ
ncbi:chromate resistance protein ChrB domain-containing protein [Marinobacter changyiensis]|uniref:chromate resistance protein ChrB domain-containing protein n=1 Tax=Marinobacter changyiensis TaxID=2604091 RepID=UPI00126469A0|nr:chromate resistance protein ChrB domain-containing protein [Marinobacter changyiensis]